jgi:hypothetical protein
MKRLGTLMMSAMLTLLLFACIQTTTLTTGTDDFDYSVLSFPSYMAENPVRYLQTNDFGMPFDGWQNFGPEGEIQTHPWPWTTYAYQMYSYFIRNDLQSLYSGLSLPERLDEMPEWIAQTNEDGHRILWFSMTARTLPSSITLLDVQTLLAEDPSAVFLRAEYDIIVSDATQRWIVYFMETNGLFSSYSIRVNEMVDNVRVITDGMVKTYRVKPSTTE